MPAAYWMGYWPTVVTMHLYQYQALVMSVLLYGAYETWGHFWLPTWAR